MCTETFVKLTRENTSLAHSQSSFTHSEVHRSPFFSCLGWSFEIDYPPK